MAHLRRLIILTLAAFFSVLATAALPQVQTKTYYTDQYGSPSVSPWAYGHSSAAALCAAVFGFQLANAGQTQIIANNETQCSAKYIEAGREWIGWQQFAVYVLFTSSMQCPVGSALSGGSCQCLSPLVEIGGECKLPACPVGQHEEGGACVPDNCEPNETRVNGVCVPEPPCPAGQSRVNGVCKPFKCPAGGDSDQWYELEGPGKASTCLYNHLDNTYCVLTITPQIIGIKDGKPTYYGGYGVYTGGTCGPSEPGKPTPVDPDKPDGDPDKGTKPPGPNDPEPGEKPGGNNPGGPGSNPTPPNTDGTCPAGMYKSGGQCYQKDPPPQPPDGDGKCPSGYMKVDSQCIPLMPKPDDSDGDGKDDDEEEGDESSFSGQCESVSCEGDAIQCAIVRDQYKRSCELMQKESAESQLYGSHKGKEGNQTGDLPGNETISLSGRIDTSDPFGGGGCFGDLSVTVWGTSVSLPLSNLCQYLAMLGNILVAVSMLMAARIVTRG